MRSIFLLALVVLAAVASEEPTIGYLTDKGLNLTNPERFPYRVTVNEKIVFSKADNPTQALFTTSNFKGAEASTDDMVVGGIVSGVVIFDNRFAVVPPTVGGIHYPGKYNLTARQLASAIFKGQADVMKRILGVSLLGVIEYDNKNVPVRFIPFNVSATAENRWSNITAIPTEDESLSAYTLYYPAGNSGNFRVTAVASRVAGVLKYGYAPVSPKSLTYLVEIDNHMYLDPNYHLGLVTMEAIKQHEGVISKNRTFRYERDTPSKLYNYASLPQYAVADDKLVFCEIDQGKPYYRVSVDADTMNVVNGMLFNSEMLTNFATIHFPANAQHIIYNFAVGNEEIVHDCINPEVVPYGGASTLVLSAFALLVALLLVF